MPDMVELQPYSADYQAHPAADRQAAKVPLAVPMAARCHPRCYAVTSRRWSATRRSEFVDEMGACRGRFSVVAERLAVVVVEVAALVVVAVSRHRNLPEAAAAVALEKGNHRSHLDFAWPADVSAAGHPFAQRDRNAGYR